MIAAIIGSVLLVIFTLYVIEIPLSTTEWQQTLYATGVIFLVFFRHRSHGRTMGAEF